GTAAAIVAYFVYSFVLPTIFGVLAAFQEWFRDIQAWVDFGFAQTPLFEGDVTGEQWAQMGVSGLIWFVIPMTIGVWAVLRSEVK
ncbi:MAG: ABC transporter permease, partial [Aeromicrobium sp.]